MTLPWRAAAATLLFVALLTWLMFGAADTGEVDFLTAQQTLESVQLYESMLQADVLRARAGVLRNYDPMVRNVARLRGAVLMLKARDANPEADGLHTMETSVESTVALVEHFKTDNALLQNSLTYFDRLSERLSAPGMDQATTARTAALISAMSHLTREGSPEAIQLVQSRIDDISTGRPLETADLNSLVLHARLLFDVVPSVDATIKKILATSTKESRQTYFARTQSLRAGRARHATYYRIALYLTAIALLGILIHVGLRLNQNATAMRNRAALEHVLAQTSSRFIACQPEETSVQLAEAFKMIGEGTFADRGYVLLFDDLQTTHVWTRHGLSTPSGWPQAIFHYQSEIAAIPSDIFRVAVDIDPMPEALRSSLRAFGVKYWSFAKLLRDDNLVGLLCFDRTQKPPIWLGRTGGLLRLAGEVINNALMREQIAKERAELERALQHAQRLEAIGTFTSGVAHNFNNVLNVILGNAEMLGDLLKQNSSGRRHLDRIIQAGERGREIAGQILDFGRRGQTTRRTSSVDAILSETIAQLRNGMPERSKLEIVGTTSGAVVDCEPAQLQQVLMNLVRNAAQASHPSGTITVELKTVRASAPRTLSHGRLPPREYVRIAVIDQGRGMDLATQNKVFEPFFTTRAEGTGLGLATAREVIHESGGAFHVRSEPEKGSTFEVWLPVASLRRGKPPQSSTAGTLMLVGSTHADVMRGEEILAALGFEPVGFSNPIAALAALQSAPRRFDALIVERSSAVTDALDFAKSAAAISGRPVILSMGAAESVTAAQLSSASVAEVVRRPWQPGALATVLERQIAKSG